ncbi:hypothetical protein PUN28_007441 [Cardiocondyla obscurior]|uniref:Uncharacterized protein n=1 Tax=Cardiocondyla obscurior TaxID=286306 RepID=A0AAW2G3J6_9HYME
MIELIRRQLSSENLRHLRSLIRKIFRRSFRLCDVRGRKRKKKHPHVLQTLECSVLHPVLGCSTGTFNRRFVNGLNTFLELMTEAA